MKTQLGDAEPNGFSGEWRLKKKSALKKTKKNFLILFGLIDDITRGTRIKLVVENTSCLLTV